MFWIVGALFLQVVVLGVFAILVALAPERLPKDRSRLAWAVVIVSFIAFVFGSVAAYQQDRETQRLVDNVTGGDAYPVLVPGVAGGKSIILLLRNFGDSVLTGVTVTIGCSYIEDTSQREIVGTVPGHQAVRLRTVLDLNACREARPLMVNGVTNTVFDVRMTAQNGVYDEEMYFKTDPGCTGIAIMTPVQKIGGVAIRTSARSWGFIFESPSKLVYPPVGTPTWGGAEKCPQSAQKVTSPRVIGH